MFPVVPVAPCESHASLVLVPLWSIVIADSAAHRLVTLAAEQHVLDDTALAVYRQPVEGSFRESGKKHKGYGG